MPCYEDERGNRYARILELKIVEPVPMCNKDDEGAPVVNTSSQTCHWIRLDVEISNAAEGDILRSLIFRFTMATQVLEGK